MAISPLHRGSQGPCVRLRERPRVARTTEDGGATSMPAYTETASPRQEWSPSCAESQTKKRTSETVAGPRILRKKRTCPPNKRPPTLEGPHATKVCNFQRTYKGRIDQLVLSITSRWKILTVRRARFGVTVRRKRLLITERQTLPEGRADLEIVHQANRRCILPSGRVVSFHSVKNVYEKRIFQQSNCI